MREKIIFLLILMLLISTVSFAEEVDFEGRTVHIRGHNIGEETLFGSGEASAHLKKIEKDFNVNIELEQVHQKDNPDLIREGVLAGDGDGIYRLMYGQALELALDGFLYNLNDLNVPESYWMKNSFDPEIEYILGNRFLFNTEARRSLEAVLPHLRFYGFANGIFYNKDMLDEYGLPDLNELFQSGDWTWQKFKEIAVELTKDTNGDGEIDQWGIAGKWGNLNHPIVFLGSNDAPSTRVKDGKVIFALNEKPAVETFEFMRELIQSGSVKYNWGWPQKIWSIEQTGMMANHFWSYFSIAPDLIFEAGFVPFPKGPSAEKHQSDINYPWTWVIPITSKEDPQDLIELHSALFMDGEEYIASEEMEELIYQGLGQFATSQDMLDNFMYALKNIRVDKYGQKFLLGVSLKDLEADIVYEEKPAQTALDSVVGSAQKRLDQRFDQ